MTGRRKYEHVSKWVPNRPLYPVVGSVAEKPGKALYVLTGFAMFGFISIVSLMLTLIIMVVRLFFFN